MKAERQYKERTSRVIQPSKGSGGHIVDNRSSFMTINETKGLMRNDHVAQRMVIVGSDPVEVDSVIAADISFQHQKAGGVLLTLGELLGGTPSKYGIKKDGSEGIILTTHGEPGKVGDFGPSEIIDGLKKIANIEKAKYIYIASCDAATSPGGEVPSVIAEIGAAFPGINVCGAPGIAITDYRGISGDYQTVYKKNEPKGIPFQDVACVIENAVTLSLFPNVKDSLGLDDLDKVEKKGIELRSQGDFIEFYDTLINALLGQFNVDRLIFFVETYRKECEKQLATAENQSTIIYFQDQLKIVPLELEFVKKQIPVITDARKKDAPLRNKAGSSITYDSL